MNNEFDNIVITRHRESAGWKQNWKLLSLLGVSVLLLGTLLGSLVTAKGWSPFASAKAVEEAKPAVALPSPTLDQTILNGGFSQIAKTVTPAVVTIQVSARESQRRPFGFIDPFRDFFGLPDQDDEGTPRRRVVPSPNRPPNTQERDRSPLVPNGVGSGVIVTGDGYILTNNHVVEGAEKVEVFLHDQRQFTAKVIGADPPGDLAVIKIEGENFPTVPFGDSDAAQVGDLVLAVGNPLGIGQTVTMGIISAKGRSTSLTLNPREQPYEDLIQTDASINRGNSGGALVNLRGELIGIPSQILAGGSGGSIGIGFAIPTKMARNAMDQLIKGGKVRRGKLGITVTVIDPKVAAEFGYKGFSGAFVQNVDKGQPADLAGIRNGDIITEFNGQHVKGSGELRNMASQTPPGTSVKVKVWRDGAEREFIVKLGEVSDPPKEKAEPLPSSTNKGTGPLAGIGVETLTPEKARELRLPEGARGVLVTEVDPRSDAALSGLDEGMVIEEVGRQPVSNVSEFTAALQKLGGRKNVLLRVRTGATGRYLMVGPRE
jgi:Do/DeqQ family serine protease